MVSQGHSVVELKTNNSPENSDHDILALERDLKLLFGSDTEVVTATCHIKSRFQLMPSSNRELVIVTA